MMIVLLLIANVAVYLFMAAQTGAMTFHVGTLYAWGGNLGLASLHGQYWRLLTALFVHAGFTHVLGNMVLLLITGGFLEQKVGSVRFLAVYLLSGLAASVLSAWMHPEVVSIGASGAIAGLLGAMLTLKLMRRAPEVSGAWMVQIILINGLNSFMPSVDGVAHLGGFAAGLGFGALLAARLPAAFDGGPDAELPVPAAQPHVIQPHVTQPGAET